VFTELRSGTSSATALLVLLNNSSHAYSVQWLDFKGKRQDYGMLAPMSYRPMQTFLTHAWELRDTVSGRLSYFVVDAPLSRWRVDD
jgi:hypothetical protein